MFIGAINAHDRDRFEVHLIATGDLPSAEAGYRDHPDDRIWDIGDISNAELAGHIAEARLDMLVDLNGYSDLARMPVLLHRAAPVQLAWANMYATTGFATVDCVVGDRWTIPPDEERFCVERVRRVPRTYLAFDVFYPVPDVAPPPWRRTGHVTFGSLMSAYKITDQVIASWSRILRGVPGSRLLVRNQHVGPGVQSRRFHWLVSPPTELRGIGCRWKAAASISTFCAPTIASTSRWTRFLTTAAPAPPRRSGRVSRC